MCPLKTATGTTAASPAPAAPPPWWAKALCRMETKCCARVAARQGPEPGLRGPGPPKPGLQGLRLLFHTIFGTQPLLKSGLLLGSRI